MLGGGKIDGKGGCLKGGGQILNGDGGWLGKKDENLKGEVGWKRARKPSVFHGFFHVFCILPLFLVSSMDPGGIEPERHEIAQRYITLKKAPQNPLLRRDLF